MPPKKRTLVRPPARKRTKKDSTPAKGTLKQTTLTTSLEVSKSIHQIADPAVSTNVNGHRKTTGEAKVAMGKKNVRKTQASSRDGKTNVPIVPLTDLSILTDKENAKTVENTGSISKEPTKRKPKAAAGKKNPAQKLGDQNANFSASSSESENVNTQTPEKRLAAAKKVSPRKRKVATNRKQNMNKEMREKPLGAAGKVPTKQKTKKTRVLSSSESEERTLSEHQETPEPVPSKKAKIKAKAKTVGKARARAVETQETENALVDSRPEKENASVNKKRPRAKKTAGKEQATKHQTPPRKSALKKTSPANQIEDTEDETEERSTMDEPTPAKRLKIAKKSRRTSNVTNGSSADRSGEDDEMDVSEQNEIGTPAVVPVEDNTRSIRVNSASSKESSKRKTESERRKKNPKQTPRSGTSIALPSNSQLEIDSIDQDIEELEDQKEMLMMKILRTKRDIAALKMCQQKEIDVTPSPEKDLPKTSQEVMALQDIENRLKFAAEITGLKPLKILIEKDPSNRYLRHGYLRGNIKNLEFIMTFDNPVDRATKKGSVENLHVYFPAGTPPGLERLLETWEEYGNIEQCLNLMSDYQKKILAREEDLQDLCDFYKDVISVSTNEETGDKTITVGDGENKFFEIDWLLSKRPPRVPGTLNYSFRLRLTEQGSELFVEQQLQPVIIVKELLKNPKSVTRTLAELVKDTVTS